MFWYMTLPNNPNRESPNPNRTQKKNLNPSLKIHSITTSFALI